MALAVFAVIGTAAFALLDQTLRSERIASERLAKLFSIQRTMRVLSIYTMQAIAGTVKQDSLGIHFRRRGALSDSGGMVAEGLDVRYALDGGLFVREIGAVGANPARQVLLTDFHRVNGQFVEDGAILTNADDATDIAGIGMFLNLTGQQPLLGLFQVPHDPEALSP